MNGCKQPAWFSHEGNMLVTFKKYTERLLHARLMAKIRLSKYMLSINATNQSNVSTKLKKHDFVIPEIEVTSQLIDLRSSAAC